MMKTTIHGFWTASLCGDSCRGLFLGPWKINSHDPKVIAQAATAMNDAVFRGDHIKNEAIATGKYVPFLAHPN